MSSIRMKIIGAIKDACKLSGAYEVRRGRINWLKFPFDKYPRAISIMIPEEDLTVEPTQATVSLEMMARMPDHSQDSVDDEILDQMRQDAWDIMKSLVPLKDGNDSLFLAVQPLPSLEIADSDRELQGIEQPFIVEY